MSNQLTQIPVNLLWGVDIAIKKLRPGAHFQLEGTNFTNWIDPNGLEPPTWEEVMDQFKRDEEAANKWLAETK